MSGPQFPAPQACRRKLFLHAWLFWFCQIVPVHFLEHPWLAAQLLEHQLERRWLALRRRRAWHVVRIVPSCFSASFYLRLLLIILLLIILLLIILILTT